MIMVANESVMIDGARFEVVEGPDATDRWLDEVCKASDSNRESLGFLPRSVFGEFSRRNRLLILLARTAGASDYAGHLLFDTHFPRAHVRQIFVKELYRGSGAAAMMLAKLRGSLAADCFISIYARVAEDLGDANRFWERQRFYVQRVEKGGASRNRRIVVRSHELDSPQLFSGSGLSEHNPLGLVEPQADAVPMYLLDMNVLFDVQPRRLRRASVIGLFQAERMNFCRLAISSEVREELRRNLGDRLTDPMEALVETLPSFPVDTVDDQEEELAQIVFGDVLRQRALSPNERSDIRHLVTVIQHDLAGLITNDTALLGAANEIEQKFRIKVVSSGVFETDDPFDRREEAFDTVRNRTLRLQPMSAEHEREVRALLGDRLRLSGSTIAANWLPPDLHDRISARWTVWGDGRCIGYAAWPSPSASDRIIRARVAVDESHADGIEAARLLLRHMVERLSVCGPRQVRVDLAPRQSYLREIGASLGFVGEPGKPRLSKFVLGMLLAPANWADGVETLAGFHGPKLPNRVPMFSGPDQLIAAYAPDGNLVHVSLDRLESLLSPALLCLPGRPAVLTPVRAAYAEHLLGHSRQMPLLPLSSASLHSSRAYLGDHRLLRKFKRGTLMFFYESGKGGGRSEVVAVARVRQAYLRDQRKLSEFDLEQSVLTGNELRNIGKSQLKSVILFDNIFQLLNPVSLASLRKIGCGKSNMITTEPVGAAQAQKIIEMGFGFA